MYGMVNEAIRSMVCEKIGSDQWVKICDQLQIDSTGFDVLVQYDDEVTLNLVLSVSELLKKEPQETLESFGEYWISFAYKSEYAQLLNTFASGPLELIQSLNNLHTRLEMSFPDLAPPSFEIYEQGEDFLLVNYYTHRSLPLQYFVKGLFQGIFKHFDEACVVEILEHPLSKSTATFKIIYDR